MSRFRRIKPSKVLVVVIAGMTALLLGSPDCLDCGPTVTHTRCTASNQCTEIDGPGLSECTGNAQCFGDNVCMDNLCSFVPHNFGTGGPTCSTNTECDGKRLACTAHNTCSLVPGYGESTCVTNGDCYVVRLACQEGSCQLVPGTGEDQCQLGDSCEEETHLACVGEECKQVSGPGPDKCFFDSSCVSPNEEVQTCQNNACVSVTGTGSDKCQNAENCSGKRMKCLANECQPASNDDPAARDECQIDDDCGRFKRSCVDGTCTLVPAAENMEDACSNDADCDSPKRLACTGNDECSLVDVNPLVGPFSNTCTSNADCAHSRRICDSLLACVVIPTGGPNQCGPMNLCQ